MTTVNLPDGMSLQSITAALQFLASQSALKAYKRPSGLLQPNMIRGVDPNYVYEYRPYPKAITPPDVIIADAAEEKKLRVKWNRPLPWGMHEPNGAQYIREYYERQEYPKRETPPVVIVADAVEEAGVRAGWRTEFGSDGGIMYPAWFFSATAKPVLVSNAREREKLGEGWYENPAEALAAARGKPEPVPAKEELERAQLEKIAEQLDVRIDTRMKTRQVKQ